MPSPRREIQKTKTPPKPNAGAPGDPLHRKPPDQGWRSWFEALVLAFVLAMFVRNFLFELFKIPTGSMIPTLIGGTVANIDVTGDGHDDLLALQSQQSDSALVYEWTPGGVYEAVGPKPIPPNVLQEWIREGKFHTQHDRIFVNKFAYWFHPPNRGDIVVFKVPDVIWDPAKPMYIKRAVGLPGDTLKFDLGSHIVWQGREDIARPEFFETHKYLSAVYDGRELHRYDYIDYGPSEDGRVTIEKVRVPEDELFVMGDNTHSSLDSRYWGAFDLNRLRGKAFFRYWPLKQAKFVR